MVATGRLSSFPNILIKIFITIKTYFKLNKAFQLVIKFSTLSFCESIYENFDARRRSDSPSGVNFTIIILIAAFELVDLGLVELGAVLLVKLNSIFLHQILCART